MWYAWSLLLLCLSTVTSTTLWKQNSFQTSSFLDDWKLDGDHDFGDESMALVDDPDGSSSNKVLRIFYKEGSYSGSGDYRGAQFYSRPISPRTCLTLDYKIYFAENFDFVKGGKLPGLWGGSQECSGGRNADECFSTRYMWRSGGDGVVYAYIPDNQKSDFCDRNEVHCNYDYGNDIGRTWVFKTGQWQRISQTVKLNSVGSENGALTVRFNRTEVLQVKDLVFRNSDDIEIEGIFFSTFFGGGSSSWASPTDTYTYYKEFQLSDRGC
ncbi:uncharacterized protein [Haliotis cracherodii]|uniref:uncharacterized protein n=1 Tax=Haliotis cracherodii TaxID=6455 RepID=UPI0039E9EE28